MGRDAQAHMTGRTSREIHPNSYTVRSNRPLSDTDVHGIKNEPIPSKLQIHSLTHRCSL